MEIQLGNIGNIIQLAIAPAFLLIGVNTHLSVLNNRLIRIIDRSRVVEKRLSKDDEPRRQAFQLELDVLYRRMHLMNRAITLNTACALLSCVVIAVLFLGDVLDLELATPIAVLFVLAMLALIGSFAYLLREIFTATRNLSTSMRHLLAPKKS